MASPKTYRLVVDWPECTGRALCAELLPEAIGVDEWGFPLIHTGLDARLVGAAKEAASACPRRALRLVRG